MDDASVPNGSVVEVELAVEVALKPSSAVPVAVPPTVKVNEVLMAAVSTTLGSTATRVSPELSCVPPIVIRYEFVAAGLVQSLVVEPTTTVIVCPPAIDVEGQSVSVRFSFEPPL